MILGPPSLWRWVLWFAVLGGLAQTLIAFILRLAANRLVFLSEDAIWMAPIANIALFGLAATGLYLATVLMNRKTAVAVAWAVFVFLGGLGPALLASKLHPVAAVVQLGGVAVQSARLVRARAEQVDGFIRWSLPAVLTVAVLAGLAQYGSREVLAQRQDASLPRVSANAPNVILIVLDTVRAANLSLYGYERQTSPHLDEFARGGVVFDRALSTSSWTLPAHASMFTGRLPNEVTADWLTALDGTHRTIAEVLTGRGYATVGIVANLTYTTKATGLSRGFQRYSDFTVSVSTIAHQSWLVRPLLNRVLMAMHGPRLLPRKHGATVTDEYLDWLDSGAAGRPFFAFLNYFDTHQPYQPPPQFDRFGSGGPMPDLANRSVWSQKEIQRSIDAYDGTIAYVDQEVARLIDGLRSRQLLDNTLIVVTSDHGEQFGEHGLYSHANSLYRQALEVPFVISFPARVPAGLRIAHPVSLVDLPATILDLIQTGDAAAFPGQSLSRFWNPMPGGPGLRPPREATADRRSLGEGGQSGTIASPLFAETSQGINLPPELPISKGRAYSVVLDGVHYIRNGDGSEELYDFERDPAEAQSLIGRPGIQQKLEAARLATGLIVPRRSFGQAPASSAFPPPPRR